MEEYIDDWYCNNCGHGSLTESDDDCPECGTKNGESYPEEAA